MSGRSGTYDLHKIHEALLVEPASESQLRFLVITAKGARHVDVDAVRKLVEVPEGLTEQNVDQILSRHVQAIREQVRAEPIDLPSPAVIDPNTLPVFHRLVPVEVPVEAPEDVVRLTEAVTASGNAIAFLRNLGLMQGNPDKASDYWPEPPEETDRPVVPPSGSTVEEIERYLEQDAAWISQRRAELTHWRLQCRLTKSDGSQAAESPVYDLSHSTVKSLAAANGLPEGVQASDETVSLLVPILLQGFQELYKYIHSPEYMSRAVAHFHESLRQERASRQQSPESE